MKLRALLMACGISLAVLSSAEAKDKRPKSNNANLQTAMRKAKKVRPTAKQNVQRKSKVKNKKQPAAHYGVKHV